MEKGYRLQQYVFVEPLGGGGMAEVWKARHAHLEEFAAIKFLLPAIAGDPEIRGRFLLEGRSQFRLRHPNIVRSTNFITQDNQDFLVMDYIEGRSLHALALDEAPLAVDRVIQICLPLLDALAHAHDKGIIHRDVKLQNILLDENDKAYLTDFGIAKALGHQGSTAGRHKTTNVLLGSMECMSPEQIQRPGDVDHRSDIYSLGCVLYDLLAGQPPFVCEEGTESNFEIMRRHVFERPTPLRQLNPNVPENVESIVMRALEKDRNARFSSCREMAAALAGREYVAVKETKGTGEDVVDPVQPPPVVPSPQGERKPMGAGTDGAATAPKRRQYSKTQVERIEERVEEPRPVPPVSPPTTTQPDSPASKTWLSRVVVVALVALFGVVGFMVYQFAYKSPAVQPPVPVVERKPPEPPPTPPPIVTPPPVVPEKTLPPPIEPPPSGGGKPPVDQAALRLDKLRADADQKLSAQQRSITGLEQEVQDLERRLQRLEMEVSLLATRTADVTQSARDVASTATRLENQANQAAAPPPNRARLKNFVDTADSQLESVRRNYTQLDNLTRTQDTALRTTSQQQLSPFLDSLGMVLSRVRPQQDQLDIIQRDLQTAGPQLSNEQRRLADLGQSLTKSVASLTELQQRASTLNPRILSFIATIETGRSEAQTRVTLAAKAVDHAKNILATLSPDVPVSRDPVPSRGTFSWRLDLREGQTAFVRFKPDGQVDTLSIGRLLPDFQGFRGVQAEVRLSSDKFEITQPLLPSTGFLQIELKCKRGRCNETVQVTWTRN